jgi:drug/metabolite transporter (DMT)-like permease
MSNQTKAYVYALIAVFFWSTVASAFKISLRYVDSLQLLFFSSLISTIVLFIMLILQRKLYILRQLSYRNYLHSILLGFLNPFLYYTILFKAYSLLRAQEAQPLNYTWGIMIAILSIPILKQKIGFKSIVAIVISFIGVLIISTQGDIFNLKFTNLTGVIMAVGSSVIWALFWIYNVKDRRNEIVKLFLNFIFGFSFILIATLAFSKITLPDAKVLLCTSYVGLFEMGITFLIWLKALSLSDTTARVSNLIYLSPLFSLVFIHFIVGEEILPSTIVGLFFIIGGVILQQYKRS